MDNKPISHNVVNITLKPRGRVCYILSPNRASYEPLEDNPIYFFVLLYTAIDKVLLNLSLVVIIEEGSIVDRIVKDLLCTLKAT